MPRWFALPLLLAGCSYELESPEPTVDAVDPALVCNDQLTTTVTLFGSNLTPLPAGVAAGETTLILPKVWLTRAQGIGGADVSADEVPVDGSVQWIDDATMSFVVDPELALVEGVFDVSVENADGRGAMVEMAFASVPPPVADAFTPDLLCLEQGAESATIAGAGFLEVEGTLPVVHIGDVDVTPDAANACVEVGGPVAASSCTELAVTLGQDLLPPGVYDVSVTNPETAACTSTEALQVEIVPRPKLDSAVPQISCVDQMDEVFTLSGSDFLVLADGTMPAVTFGTYTAQADAADGCTALSGPAGGQLCTELTFTVPQDAVAPGVHPLTITNPPPADCVSTEAVLVEVVGQPMLDSVDPVPVDPDLTCLEQGDRAFVLSGSGFLLLADGTVPDVTVGGAAATVDSAEGCTALTGPAGGESCTTLNITVAANAVAPDTVNDVIVTNPAPAECFTEENPTIETFSAPTLSSIVEPLTCGDEPTDTFVLTGDFLVVDGVLPTVTIGTFTATADGFASCTTHSARVEVCTELTVTVSAGDLQTGLLDVAVVNPDPIGCTTMEPVQVEVIAPPTVAAVEPAGVCLGDTGTVTVDITGSGFLTVGAVVPDVTIGGVSLGPVTASGCTTPLVNVAGELCDTLTVSIPAGTFPDAVADHQVVVTNPDPAACASDDPVFYSVTAPPIVTSVDPAQVCDDGSGLNTFIVNGQNFAPASEVLIGAEYATTTYIDDTMLEVNVPATLTAGVYDITVVNPGGCSDTAPSALEVVDMPLVFFVDPPTTYQGVDILATAFVSGINGDVVDVWLESAADGTVVPVTWEPWDPAQASLLRFTIPAGLTEGSYHLFLTDAVACDPVLMDAVFVEADVTLDVVSVEPPFGWTADVTPVVITGSGTPPFVDLPRVYFSPVGGGDLATKLSAVTWQSDSVLDAVVPEGLPVGSYDVLVVNPDGAIGYLPGGFDVVIDPPPLIDSVAPATLPSSADASVIVQGNHFRNPTVDLDCIDPVSGAPFQVTGLVVNSFTATTIDVTVPASSDASLSAGAVCVVVVTNDDGTSGLYAAISITNPSQNLYAWQAGTAMTTPRRALAVEAGRATRTSRYLYAIGGDDGFGTVWDTVERAKVGVFGDLGEWQELPIRLPNPTTMAGSAQLGRFVYVVGGTDGTTATADVWRAQILDPLEAPVINPDLIVTLDPAGLGEGTYIYRVAALFDMTYDDNPAGESLPSDPFVVRLPDVSPDNLQLTLTWDPIPDAIGYRVYRSDTGSGDEQWVADVLGATQFVDTGLPTDPAVTPLPAGALGEWTALPSLPMALEYPGVTIAWDPVDPTKAYLYAAGGLDAAGTLHSDIHFLEITVVDEHDHEVGAAWSLASLALDEARYELQAVTVTSELHSRIAVGDSWVYFLQGRSAVGSTTTAEAMLVGAGGDFLEKHDVSGSSRAGHGAAHASNFLYVFGGGNGTPSESGDSAEICETGLPACAGGPPDPPDIRNWNGLGISMTEPRYLLGSAQESSVIFAVGGETGAGATTSVDFTNY